MSKENNKRLKTERKKRFANTFRYIYDLEMLSDDGEFERSLRETYHPELELKN